MFHATKPGNKIGNGTAKALILWLGQYISTVLPMYSIAEWTIRNELMQIPGNLNHIMSSVRVGLRSGIHIDLTMVTDDLLTIPIGSAILVGSIHDAERVRSELDVVLESIYQRNQIPEIIDFLREIPQSPTGTRKSNLSGIVDINVNTETVTVYSGSHSILFQRSIFNRSPEVTKHMLKGIANDWKTILISIDAMFRSNDPIEVAA